MQSRKLRIQSASSILAVAFSLSFFIQPMPVFAATHSCSSHTAKVRSINLSSQVSGDNFRLCADWIKSITQSSSAHPSKTAPTSRPSNGSLNGSRSQSNLRSIPLNRSVIATANRPNILLFPANQVAPDTSVLLYSDATRHSVLRKLLGFDTLIRFTPIAYRWTTGDGFSSNRSRVRHMFQRLGTSTVRLSVVFAIEVRLVSSSKWIKTPLQIKKVADPTSVRVGERRVIQGIPVFVIRNCFSRPNAVGCLTPAP